MAETTRRVEYYHVTVPDQPGTAYRTLAPLKEAGVNLLAFLAFPTGDKKSQIDLFPEDAAALERAASKAGLTLSAAKKAFLIQGDDRAGAAAEIVRKLGDAGVNITASAATAFGGRYGMILWVAPADYDRAAKTLGA